MDIEKGRLVENPDLKEAHIFRKPLDSKPKPQKKQSSLSQSSESKESASQQAQQKKDMNNFGLSFSFDDEP